MSAPRETSERVELALVALDKCYAGPWGLKASEEDAVLAIIDALYPAFPKGAQGIYAIRADEMLTAAVDNYFELISAGDELRDAVALFLPALDAAMGNTWAAVVCPSCGAHAEALVSDVDGSVAYVCRIHGCVGEVGP